MLKAWTGEPFEYRGTTVQVTPRPFTQPHPTLMLGGSSKVAVRRAARFGLPYLPPANLPELEAYYYEQCAEHGTQGFCAMPPEHTAMTFVAEDPERVWRDLGHHFFEESSTYSSWQPPGQTSSVHSHATNVEELRAEGIYEVVTPAELVDRLEGCAVRPPRARCTRSSAACPSTKGGRRCASTSKRSCPHWADPLFHGQRGATMSSSTVSGGRAAGPQPRQEPCSSHWPRRSS